MKMVLLALAVYCFLSNVGFCESIKKEHALAENMINWPPDKIFFEIISLDDKALDTIKNKIAEYRTFLIEALAHRSVKEIVKEKEFEKCKEKISRCSDTENLILFIRGLRKYEEREDLDFDGEIF